MTRHVSEEKPQMGKIVLYRYVNTKSFALSMHQLNAAGAGFFFHFRVYR